MPQDNTNERAAPSTEERSAPVEGTEAATCKGCGQPMPRNRTGNCESLCVRNWQDRTAIPSTIHRAGVRASRCEGGNKRPHRSANLLQDSNQERKQISCPPNVLGIYHLMASRRTSLKHAPPPILSCSWVLFAPIPRHWIWTSSLGCDAQLPHQTFATVSPFPSFLWIRCIHSTKKP